LIRAVVTGVTGRMGSTLVRMVRDEPGMSLAGATERKGTTAIGLDAGLAARLGTLEVTTVDSLEAALERAGDAQVVIDFTNPEASIAHARVCAHKKVPLVVGSTGFSEAAREQMAACAQAAPVVMAPNMSVGVNLVIKMAAELAKVLGEGYDVEVLEAHHRMKKDAPSGTALRLGEELAKALGREKEALRLVREGQIGERGAQEIGIQTLRGGDVVGEHTVYFFGDGERIELTHRASSRDQFARGALRAARWVVGRPPGLYGMNDVLGLG
jgi:4-hydroxy-tetrahydrodipicolinate reductase